MTKSKAPSYEFETIFTLDARTNMFLEVMTDHFKLSDQRVFAEIWLLHRRLTELLATKGIQYPRLRPALSPSIDASEGALVFDSTKSGTSFYGQQAIHAILPALHRDSTHSVLCGDWIGDRGDFGDWLAASPSTVAGGALSRVEPWDDSLYFVFLNNLSRATTERLKTDLRACPSFIGYLDLTLATPLKACLSTLLVRDFIKHKQIIIKGHEDDRDDNTDVNLSLIDFESLGYTVKSVPLMLYGLFLAYKIERPVLQKERDTRFSLNALTPGPIGLSEFDVFLEESKLGYLNAEKAGSMKSAGLSKLSCEEVASQIRAKIEATYIYNLSRSTNGEVLKLNVILEFAGGVRRECALEYLPSRKVLRVITFY